MLRWMGDHMSYASQELYARGNRELNEHYKDEPWYHLVRHEDLVSDHSLILEMLSVCGLEPSPALKEFLEKMNSEDRDTTHKHRDTVMTVQTMMQRWRGMPLRAIDQAEEFTAEHWDWAGYTPLKTKGGPR